MVASESGVVVTLTTRIILVALTTSAIHLNLPVSHVAQRCNPLGVLLMCNDFAR